MTATDWKNQLYFGDNLDILRNHVANASVDLIYLDLPFNSNANYNVLFQEKTGQQSAAQITAFEDTWHWSLESEGAYQVVVTNALGKLPDLLQAMRSFLGDNDMMAYLTMMAQRMVELHRVLKDTGSIYLHCDPTASHYLKLLMDSDRSTEEMGRQADCEEIKRRPQFLASKLPFPSFKTSWREGDARLYWAMPALLSASAATTTFTTSTP